MDTTEIPVTLRDKYSGVRHSGVVTLIDCGDSLSIGVPRIWYKMSGGFDYISTSLHLLQGVHVPLFRLALANRLYRLDLVSGVGQLVFDIRDEKLWSVGMEYA